MHGQQRELISRRERRRRRKGGAEIKGERGRRHLFTATMMAAAARQDPQRDVSAMSAAVAQQDALMAAAARQDPQRDVAAMSAAAAQ